MQARRRPALSRAGSEEPPVPWDEDNPRVVRLEFGVPPFVSYLIASVLVAIAAVRRSSAQRCALLLLSSRDTPDRLAV